MSLKHRGFMRHNGIGSKKEGLGGKNYGQVLEHETLL
jgi:hypothetical protein